MRAYPRVAEITAHLKSNPHLNPKPESPKQVAEKAGYKEVAAALATKGTLQ